MPTNTRTPIDIRTDAQRERDRIWAEYEPLIRAMDDECRAALRPIFEATNAEIKAIDDEANVRRKEVWSRNFAAISEVRQPFVDRLKPILAERDAKLKTTRREG